MSADIPADPLRDAKAELSELMDQLRAGAIDVKTAAERRRTINTVIRDERLKFEQLRRRRRTLTGGGVLQ